jgi:hypothetical protein
MKTFFRSIAGQTRGGGATGSGDQAAVGQGGTGGPRALGRWGTCRPHDGHRGAGRHQPQAVGCSGRLAAEEGKLDVTLKDREAALQELLHIQQQLLGLRRDVAQSDGREQSHEQEPYDAGEQLKNLRTHLATVQGTLATKQQELTETRAKLAAAQAGLSAAKDEAATARAGDTTSAVRDLVT